LTQNCGQPDARKLHTVKIFMPARAWSYGHLEEIVVDYARAPREKSLKNFRRLPFGLDQLDARRSRRAQRVLSL
jgi:hypothetical protein